MRILTKSLLLFATLILATSCGCKQDEKCDQKTSTQTVKDQKMNSKELEGIRKALDLYAEAAVKGDSKIAKPVFAETATMTYNENGKLVSVPIQVLFDYYDKDCPQQASYEISDYSIADDAAIVRIESKFGDAEFSDMFTMVKDGDDWKIASKIYHLK